MFKKLSKKIDTGVSFTKSNKLNPINNKNENKKVKLQFYSFYKNILLVYLHVSNQSNLNDVKYITILIVNWGCSNVLN